MEESDDQNMNSYDAMWFNQSEEQNHEIPYSVILTTKRA